MMYIEFDRVCKITVRLVGTNLKAVTTTHASYRGCSVGFAESDGLVNVFLILFTIIT